MKTVKGVLNNKYLCFFTLVITIAFYIFYLTREDPITNSVCSIGKKNINLYIIWCALTIITIYLNFKRLYLRTGFRSVFGKIMLFLAFGGLVITYFTLNYQIYDAIYFIHMSVSGAAAFFAVISFIICMFYASYYSNIYLFLTVLFVIVILLCIALILLTNFTSAIYETAPFIMSYLILLIVNNFKGLILKKPSVLTH